MDGPFLVIVDADKIHDYVFAPQQLKLIRGGSAIQAELNRQLLLEELRKLGLGNGNVDPATWGILDEPTLALHSDQPWEAVYAGGGTALVLFRDEKLAEAYTVRAAQLFPERTAATTASCAVVASEDKFRQTYEKVRRRLETAKTARAEHHFPAGGPYWKTCDTCGMFPAARRRREPSGGEGYPCAACALRLEASENAPFLKNVIAEARVSLAAPGDFDQLARGSRPENYLALVYIDINRLGRFLVEHASASPAEFRKYSNAIHKTVLGGVVAGCKRLCTGLGDGDPAPFEILLVGGDDAVVMLRAQDVFDFLVTFETEFRDGPPLRTLDFSVGVVWAHHHFPIAQSLALAEELLKSAKRKPGRGFAVDYLIVTEPLAGQIGSRDRPNTRKPYSLEEFLALRDTLAQWKRAEVPSTKAKELYRIAYLSQHQAILDYYFLLSRLEREHKMLFHKQFPGGLWDETGRTSAADLIELWDFVEAR